MPWPKHLYVDKRIVVLLSASTYESFPKALREAVSNAYDADATRVDVDINVGNDIITITDNGRGMTPDQFDFYLRIAGHQRDRPRKTTLGRLRIGQFGIGFLSVFPFCDRLQVESTVRGSAIGFRATIPAREFTAEAKEPGDVTAIDITGTEYSDPAAVDRQFTRITMTGLTYLVKQYFRGPGPGRQTEKNSVTSWAGLKRLRWELAETLPVDFPPASKLAEKFGAMPSPIAVYVNGSQLFRNDYTEEVLDAGQDQVDSVRFEFAMGTPWKAVHPYEARGVKVRLHGVGIGPRTYFDLQIAGRTFSRLHWLTGEVHVLAGLDEAVALNRDSFTATESFDRFREFWRARLRRLAYEVEDIDVSRRALQSIARQSEGTGAPLLEVAQKHVEELKRKGFTVEVKAPTAASQPVKVSIPERKVTLVPRHPVFAETVSIGGRSFPVRHTTWEYDGQPLPACRLDDGVIELNDAYPLFERKNVADTIRRLQLLIVIAEQEADSKHELLLRLQELLLEEFGGEN